MRNLIPVYAIFDIKLREYTQPVPYKNDAAVTRALKDSIPGSRGIMEQHPEDFELHQVGEWDAEAGFLVGMPDRPRFLLNLGDLFGPERRHAAAGGPDIQTAPAESSFSQAPANGQRVLTESHPSARDL